MKELLTNEEIDTLMEMFRSEESELDQVGSIPEIAEAPQKDTLISPVDLLKPNRLSREQMRDLERLFENSAKAVGATMADRLRYEMICDCVAVEQVRFNNWLKMLGTAAVIYVLKAPPLDGPVIFSVTSSLLYGSVDRILGGGGKVTDVPRDFSEAEYVVADAFLEPIFEKLSESMEEIFESEWSIESRFCNPSLAHVIPNQDVVLSIHFQAGGDYLLGDLRLAIPYQALEPHLMTLGTGAGKRKQQPGLMRDVLANTVRPVPLDLTVSLGETVLPLRGLLALKRGDVVPVNSRLGEPLVAPVEGVAKFEGQVGTLGNRLAFQVANVLES